MTDATPFRPYVHLVESIGPPWTGAVKGALLQRIGRFSEKTATAGLSDGLSGRLQEVGAEGIVRRDVVAATPAVSASPHDWIGRAAGSANCGRGAAGLAGR